MSDTFRLFIAIPLPSRVKTVLLAVGEQMGQGLPARAMRWVGPNQLHLTLRFLGDTPTAQLTPLQELLGQLAQQHSAFTLHLDGVGAFPNRQRPRVIWAGLAGNVAALQALKHGLDGRLEQLGWPLEKRPFSPHVTLGRVKQAQKVGRLNWEVRLDALKVDVLTVQLVKSELRPSGPIYTIMQQVQLSGEKLRD